MFAFPSSVNVIYIIGNQFVGEVALAIALDQLQSTLVDSLNGPLFSNCTEENEVCPPILSFVKR